MALLNDGIEIHCLRDLTRGGLASALNEIAEAARVRVEVDENLIPVREDVHAACEILGLDPLHVACEGRFAAFVAAKDVQRSVKILKAHSSPSEVRLIGTVDAAKQSAVILKSTLGGNRILDMPSGEQLPRIC
jgi:hydrogenase expression/formation protein HypE